MATKLQVRRDTAANWTSNDPTLSAGEFGWESDTGYMKIGDGSTAWSSLSYFEPNSVSNTTYSVDVQASGDDADVILDGSDGTTDTVRYVAGTNLNLGVAGQNITIDALDSKYTIGTADQSGDVVLRLTATGNATGNDDVVVTGGTGVDVTQASDELTITLNAAVDDISNIDAGSPSNGDVLAYNSTTTNWEAGAPAVIAANDLSDVTITSASNNDILQWTGSAFVNLAPSSLTGFATVATSGDYDDLLNKPTSFDGDIVGSIFGDDSTLLVDGVNNVIPAGNLTGALPALDGSALTGVVAGSVAFSNVTSTPTTLSGYGITDAISDVVDDTSPQLGGNLDLNSNDITGTGDI